jgi:hypothetical protein
LVLIEVSGFLFVGRKDRVRKKRRDVDFFPTGHLGRELTARRSTQNKSINRSTTETNERETESVNITSRTSPLINTAEVQPHRNRDHFLEVLISNKEHRCFALFAPVEQEKARRTRRSFIGE